MLSICCSWWWWCFVLFLFIGVVVFFCFFFFVCLFSVCLWVFCGGGGLFFECYDCCSDIFGHRCSVSHRSHVMTWRKTKCTQTWLIFTSECHDDIIKWKHFPRYWSIVRGTTCHRWILLTNASDAELWSFFGLRLNKTVGQTIETPVIWDASALLMTTSL